MKTAVIIAAVIIIITVTGLTWVAMRYDVPGFEFLDRLPDPAALLGGILDRVTVPLRYARRPAGEHAKPLAVKFRAGGELADGTFIHTGDTGPMPAADWDTATPFPRAPRPATEASR